MKGGQQVKKAQAKSDAGGDFAAYENKCAEMDDGELKREEARASRRFKSFWQVAKAAYAFAEAVLGLLRPDDAWNAERKKFADCLSVAQKTGAGEEAVGFLDEMKKCDKILDRYRAAVVGENGASPATFSHRQGVLYAHLQRTASDLRRRVNFVVLDLMVREALVAGMRIGKGTQSLMEVKRDLQVIIAAVTKGNDKEAAANALVGAFTRFWNEVGPGVKPGSRVAYTHFKDFIRDPKNKAALGRAGSFRTFRRKYAEWLDLGRPDNGEAIAAAKRQRRKEQRAKSR